MKAMFVQDLFFTFILIHSVAARSSYGKRDISTGLATASCGPTDCTGNLGIQYGHCYTMTDVNGLHFNRVADNGVYQSGGDVDNLIFKVCSSISDCNANLDKEVPENGTFLLQDQFGPRDQYLDKDISGWVGKIRDAHMGVEPFLNLTGKDNTVAVFRGEGFCLWGDCAVCLRLNGAGLSAPCPLYPNSEKAHIGMAKNRANCKAFRFQETKCVVGVPAVPTAT